MNRVGTFRRKFGKFVSLVFLVTLFGWGGYRATRWAFTIRSIEVVGENARVIIDEKRISKNLLFFPADTLRSQVLAGNPWLADVRFEKKYPGTLRIVPTLRQPIAVLRSRDRTVLVDREGVVVSDGDGGGALPLVVIDILPFRVGETITDARVRLALSLIDSLAEDLTFTKITYEGSTYLRAESGIVDIIITQDRPIGETLATLQTLLVGFRIKGTLPKVVDLRFDKPIVTN